MTMQLEFTPAILEVLNYERYRHPLPLVQRRMEALWLKRHGLPHGQIAQLVNITENTLRDYFQLSEITQLGQTPVGSKDYVGWSAKITTAATHK